LRTFLYLRVQVWGSNWAGTEGIWPVNTTT